MGPRPKFTGMLMDILQAASVLPAGGPTPNSQKRNRSKDAAASIKATATGKANAKAKSSKVMKVGRKPAAGPKKKA